MRTSREATDHVMMARCIELSRVAASKGEYPFGAVVALDGQVVAEAINRSIRDRDVSRHAEVIALSRAQKAMGKKEIHHCTLYSNVEPCAMCAFCIREAWVKRVVYALGSPLMGGHSKWNILRDEAISQRLPESFGAVPEVVSGILLDQARRAWQEWNPLLWEVIQRRGVLAEPAGQGRRIDVQPAGRRSLWHHLQLWLAWSRHARGEAERPEYDRDKL